MMKTKRTRTGVVVLAVLTAGLGSVGFLGAQAGADDGLPDPPPWVNVDPSGTLEDGGFREDGITVVGPDGSVIPGLTVSTRELYAPPAGGPQPPSPAELESQNRYIDPSTGTEVLVE